MSPERRPWDTDPGYETYVLDRIKYMAARSVSAEIMASARLAVEHGAFDDLIYRLQVEVMGNKLAPDVATHIVRWEESRWASWWEQLKDTYRARWWMRPIIRLRPVQYVTIPRSRKVELEVHAWRTFPESTVRFPRELGHPHYTVQVVTNEPERQIL